MYDIEVNIAGYRFTQQLPGPRRRLLGPLVNRANWRPSAVREHVRQLRAV